MSSPQLDFDEESEDSFSLDPQIALSEEDEDEKELMTQSFDSFGSGYAPFHPDPLSSDDEDSTDNFPLRLEDMDLKAMGEKAEEEKITTISRIIQALPEAQVLEILGGLKEKYGDEFIDNIEEKIEEMKNQQPKTPKDTEENERWDWNSRFQNAILKVQGQTVDTVSDGDQMILWSFLAKVAGDFVQIATVYGKIIISEVYTPISEKTIKPMHLGGSIGGDKYLVKRVLFKFPKAEAGFYDEEAAAKIAGHELKGLSNLFNCGIVGLHYPMVAIIDYLGFRLIAMTHLPLSSGSLIYGSNDAGKTIYNKSPEFLEKLEETADILNIKPHMAGRDCRVRVVSPADLEGHLGTDGKFYVLDFSRVFPPEPPKKDIQGSHLFRLLRPELVKSNPVPLCPDAFSGFVIDPDDARKHNKEIQEASSRLFREIIPSVASQLNQLSKNALRRFLGPNHLLVEIIHANGINVRFMGLLRKYLNNDILRAKVMVELLSRTLKTIMRAELRQAMKDSALPLEHSYKRCVISLLNQVFGTGKFYWTNTLIPATVKKFEECLSPKEKVSDFCMKTYIKQTLGLSNFLMRFAVVSGLVFNPQTLEEFQENESLFDFRQPFDIPDLEELGAQVHHMDIVDTAMGFVLKCRAQLREGENTDRLCKIALRSFENALYSNPKHVFSLCQYASTLAVMGKYRQASDYYKLALQADRQDIPTLYEYSCFLIDVGSYTASIGYFERIIKLEPPELFRLYHSYRKKIEELPNRNNIIEDILKKLSEYVPASGKPRVDLLKRTGSEMGDLSPKDKKRKKFRPERSFKKIGRRKLSKPEKVNQSN